MRRGEISGFDKSSLLERSSSQTNHRLDRITRVIGRQLERFLVCLNSLLSPLSILLRAEHKTVREWSDAGNVGEEHCSYSPVLSDQHQARLGIISSSWSCKHWLERKIQFYSEHKNKGEKILFWNTKRSNKITHLFYITNFLKNIYLSLSLCYRYVTNLTNQSRNNHNL